MLNGLIGFVIRGLEFAVWLVVWVGPVMESTVGERSAETLVEEQKQQCDLHAFRGEPVGIAAAIALEKSMAFQFAQIVAELIQTVSIGRELKRGEHGCVDLLGGPASHGGSSVKENLQQTDDTDVLDPDAWMADRAFGDWQGKPLQNREVHMHIQRLGLKLGKTIGDRAELLAHGVEVIQSLP